MGIRKPGRKLHAGSKEKSMIMSFYKSISVILSNLVLYSISIYLSDPRSASLSYFLALDV